MNGYVVRGYVTREGVLLAPWPDAHGAVWLDELFARLVGHEIGLSLLDYGPAPPAWLGAAARQVEGGPRRARVVVDDPPPPWERAVMAVPPALPCGAGDGEA